MNKTMLVGNLKSKTSWFGIALIVLGVLYDQWQALIELIPDQYEGLVYSLIGAAIIVLRNLTSEAITDKAAPTTPPPTDEGE